MQPLIGRRRRSCRRLSRFRWSKGS